MLSSDVKRRIDGLRDTLVGKLPDPKAQVEQITIALMYKFMSDMDQQSLDLGGEASFFKPDPDPEKDFSRYAWRHIMSRELGGDERVRLYMQGIERMPINPHLPPLFRDIFRNAYLPYRDPETLRLFLTGIATFDYGDSESLGDAFEYLLSVLGSQGEAGQFRTPRHIIDMMVKVVDPRKDSTVLDPACGTAGFLISSFKHIEAVNKETPLTTIERSRMMANFVGYDISPDMTRLSRVNMYLHGFPNPRIFEYDTLTNEDNWHERFDIILANPPFMTPKGGIRPHNRFAVHANRSEVLFVDYIAEHLAAGGRAAVIVPEGIVFQGSNAYKELRRILVEQGYLYAVVSLPVGVFNPYSGVKTSVLFMDRALASHAKEILFVKVSNDGYDLGAQRREVGGSELPWVWKLIRRYQLALQLGEELVLEGEDGARALLVPKIKLAEQDYTLSGERYRVIGLPHGKWPLVALGEVCEVVAGQSPPGESYNDTAEGMPFYQGKTEFTEKYIGQPTKWTTNPQRVAEIGDILISVRAPVGPVNISTQRICIGRGLAAIRADNSRILQSFIFYFLRSQEAQIIGNAGAVFASISRDDIERIEIPLPPLEVQREIVAEVESYQRVIDGARQVVENWQPHITIDPGWPLVKLGEAVTTITPPKKIQTTAYQDEGKYPIIDQGQQYIAGRTNDESGVIDGRGGLVIFGDHTCIVKYVHDYFVQGADGIKILQTPDTMYSSYLYYYLKSNPIIPDGYNRHFSKLKEVQIPLPPLDEQQRIVAEIEREQAVIEANKQLITLLEAKIKARIARVWEL